MTTATLEKKSADRVETRTVKGIDKPDDTVKIISQLLNYMAGGEKRARFILAVVVRVIALLGLIALPALTGEAINVLQDPGGNLTELQRWILYAVIAGAVFLIMTFLAERIPGGQLPRRSNILRPGNKGPQQAPDASVFPYAGAFTELLRSPTDRGVA